MVLLTNCELDASRIMYSTVDLATSPLPRSRIFLSGLVEPRALPNFGVTSLPSSRYVRANSGRINAARWTRDWYRSYKN